MNARETITRFGYSSILLVATLVLITTSTTRAAQFECVQIFFDASSAPKSIDGIAGWGVKLLPSDAFSGDPGFVEDLVRLGASSAAVITPYWMLPQHPSRGPHDDLLKYWNFEIQKTLGSEKKGGFGILIDLGRTRVKFDLLKLTSSGTEANNALYELAEFAFEKRTGHRARRANLLFFGDLTRGLLPYGGTSGRIRNLSLRFTERPESVNELMLPSPQTKFFGEIPQAELRSLQEIEFRVLNMIREKVADESLEIGGIFLEPISVGHGIHFFRPEFLRQLRELADELGVPLMADEIYTGGGKTGTFWAFQQYPGFFPDVITFGKGLELKGVLQVTRTQGEDDWMPGKPRPKPVWDFPRFDPFQNTDPSQWHSEKVQLDNTSIASTVDVMRALFVIKYIRKHNLVESASLNGAALLARFRARAAELGIPESEIQGIGMVFHFSNHIDRFFDNGRVSNYEGRVTPMLTTQLSDWPAFAPR